MFDPNACIKALLFSLFQCFFGRATLAAISDKRRDVWVVSFQLFGNRVIGRNTNEGRTHQSIRARGVNLNRLTSIGAFERELQAAGFADPVGLHQLHLGGPIIEVIDAVQQITSHVRNLKEPLGQFAAFNVCTRAPTFAVDHLFVCQNGHIDRVPVHHGVLAVDQTLVQHIDEQRLLLAVVFGIAGCELTAPVDRQAKRFHLAAHVGDVLVCPILGVAARCHRGVFRGHTKCVPAHWVQDVVTRRHFETRYHVAHGVVPHVTHMDAARRVGEHLEHVVFRLCLIAFCGEYASLFPGGLPFLFDISGGIAGHRSVLWDMETPGNRARRGIKRFSRQFL